MSNAFTESTIEDAALELFSGLGYTILQGQEQVEKKPQS